MLMLMLTKNSIWPRLNESIGVKSLRCYPSQIPKDRDCLNKNCLFQFKNISNAPSQEQERQNMSFCLCYPEPEPEPETCAAPPRVGGYPLSIYLSRHACHPPTHPHSTYEVTSPQAHPSHFRPLPHHHYCPRRPNQ